MTKANVSIHTVHDPTRGTTGEVWINGKLIIIIHSKGIDDRSTANNLFTQEEIKEMDRLIREWINENLRKK